ncbi:MAG TPA: hypothetical protein VG106_13350, partial [Vicinamibacterales bacterium]|nr:hypothetical protein [Vicinamibacterales bacterium]
MLKRIAFSLALFASLPLFAQDAADLERRLRAIEEKLAAMQTPEVAELRRQIEILGQEIEALKTRQTDTVVAADTEQHGLGAAAS